MQIKKVEQRILIPGLAGNIDVATTLNSSNQPGIVGIVCHPHPLFHGTMDNKVVTTITRAFEMVGAATVRFNFRGVGRSEGNYDYTKGEIDDLTTVIEWVQSLYIKNNRSKECIIWLAGFSFGSYISTAYFAHNQPSFVQRLISVAPPIEKFPFVALPLVSCPWLIIQGENDEVVVSSKVANWVKSRSEVIQYVSMPVSTHFFHGQLLNLRKIILDWIITN